MPRAEQGPTELLNLVAMCRSCHTRLRLHRWQMTLQPDGTLHTRIGRHRYTTRARLPGSGPPARPPDPNPDAAAPKTRQPPGPDQPVPF